MRAARDDEATGRLFDDRPPLNSAPWPFATRPPEARARFRHSPEQGDPWTIPRIAPADRRRFTVESDE